MRGVVTVCLVIAGILGGAFAVSDHHLLGAFMGAVLGLTAAVIVHAFPRTEDYPADTWLGD
ncbi:MAG: hypothetical protein KGL26_15740 [Pseudomonadota bacterium]|nr:hypothetical protein [Pseudomonadota bacterium]